MKSQFLDYTTMPPATGVTITSGSVTALFGGLNANDIALFGGIFLAVLSYVSQIIFNYLRHKREQNEQHEKQQRAKELHNLELTKLNKILKQLDINQNPVKTKQIIDLIARIEQIERKNQLKT